MTELRKVLVDGLWRIYRRSERPSPWQNDGNLPWNEPAFAARMLREHLDENHGAATRQTPERQRQLEWIAARLELQAGSRLLDITCGPGLYAVSLAERGVLVTGVDFSPASIAYARELAAESGVAERTHFIEADVRQVDFTQLPDAAGGTAPFDAAMLIYGQLAVFPRETAAAILRNCADGLQTGGKLVVELLNPERVDKKNSRWWYTDDGGLWGDGPYLHLGERFWNEEERLSTERFQILHLDSGRLDEIILSDQTYTPAELREMMRAAGFADIAVYPAWDGLELYDADEWIVYVATK